MVHPQEELARTISRLDPPEAVAAILHQPRCQLAGLVRQLEGMAEYAAWLARYADERAGCGCGDQGHQAAVEAANRAGRSVWCKAFGYSQYLDRRPRQNPSL